MDATLFDPTPAVSRKAPRVNLVPRDYQRKDHDESFRLWDSGERGVLTRIFTGGGKTPVSCMKIRTWLDRSPEHRAMIVSYERDLVWQFAQEVEDFLAITPGIEMGEEHVPGSEQPCVVVACRASLLPPSGASDEQIRALANKGFNGLPWISKRLAGRILKHLEAAPHDLGPVYESLEKLQGEPPCRLHKFDWRLHWLVIFDEAHRHAYSLKSVGHLVDWFDKNPASRRSGLTATPKRGDGISIGHKMFPGVAIDYPLYHVTKPCAVKQGWAVPYVQKYIEVEGVDFKNIKQVRGDFEEAELERVLGEEGVLARLVEPLLDMVGERRTLIFSPGVEMAKNVALYINARVLTECYQCRARKWHPEKLIENGAVCPCGRALTRTDVMKDGEQAKTISGATNTNDRKQTYLAHQAGRFQFLSVCGLCREGYNDPDISCVAIFRPVSKKASSLAEQMKGRGCRPCRSVVPVLNELLTPEERVEAIKESRKPDCLIVDLVGVTGLADCASTVQIYADGLEDEVVAAAEGILAEAGAEEEKGVAEAIEEAKKKVAEQRENEKAEAEERKRQDRERAANRAKAGAVVSYSEHDMGVGSSPGAGRASEGQYKMILFRGMKIHSAITPRQAHRIIEQLKSRVAVEEIASTNRLCEDDWEKEPASDKQIWKLGSLSISSSLAKTQYDASLLISAKLNPAEVEERKMQEIRGSADHERLTALATDITLMRHYLPADVYQRLVEAGKAKRAALVE